MPGVVFLDAGGFGIASEAEAGGLEFGGEVWAVE